MKMITLAAAAIAMSTTLAFAQSSNAPNASQMGGQPGQNTQSGASSGGAMLNNNATTGSSTKPAINDASKSGAPNADNAAKPPGASTPDTKMNR